MIRARVMGVLWLLALLLSLTVAGSYAFAELLVITAAFLISALLLGIFGGRNAAMELKTVEFCGKNREFKGILKVSNQGLLPIFYGVCEVHWENTLTLEQGKMLLPFGVKGKGQTEAVFSGKSRFCGNCRFRIAGWKNYDLMRIFGSKRETEAHAELLILPEVTRIQTELFTKEVYDMESFRYSGLRRGDDPGETFAIRAYRPGDGMKQIHWKLTEKLDQVMVKERSYPVYDSVLLLPELFCTGEHIAERRSRLAEILASAAVSLTEEKKPFDLCFYDSGKDHFYMERIESEQEFWELFYLFLRTAGREKAPDAIEKYLENRGRRQFAHYLYFTGEEHSPEEDRLKELGAVTALRCPETEAFSQTEDEICFPCHGELCQSPAAMG